jgi:LysM repeat protein
LLAANGLAKSDLIFPGQTLTVPGVAAPGTSTDRTSAQEPVQTLAYTVVSGDSACRIAARFQVPCRGLIADNALGKEALIHPGQSLTIMGVPANLARSYSSSAKAANIAASSVDAKTSEEETWPKIADSAGSGPGSGLSGVSPLDRPIDFSIQTAAVEGRTLYRINVEPEETLGHYSDWLRLGSVKKIRELNGYDATQVLASGDALLLPVGDEAQQDTFERRRQEYHRVLVEEFKENFEVTGVEEYKIQSGDSLWVLAREFELPIWVITRYNPELRSGPPRAGKSITIPRIRSRQG